MYGNEKGDVIFQNPKNSGNPLNGEWTQVESITTTTEERVIVTVILN